MKLYGTTTSPFVRKIRVLALEKGLSLPFELAQPGDVDGVVRRLSPLGKVPLLALDGGAILYDSPVIAQYIDASTQPRFIPEAPAARFETLRWEALTDELSERVVRRLLESRRPLELQWRDAFADEERRIERLVDALDAEVRQRGHVGDDRLGYADLCAGVALSYVDFRYTTAWRNGRERLAAWHSALEARPSFERTRAT